ncbi:MAG: hypothetical protein M3O26_00290 [Pseudomonadota bacterium]|nr:hypothetical protein [Pseudomonadota bacterium]
MARILDVPAFGEFSQALLVSSTFCMLACLGLQPMLQRDMPVLLLRNRRRVAVIALTQCVIVASACFLVACAISYAYVALPGISRTTLLVGLFHGLSQQVFLVVTIDSRSRGQPIRYAGQNLARAFLVLAAAIPVALVWNTALYVILIEGLISIALTSMILADMFRSARLSAATALHAAIRRMSRVQWHSAAALLVVATIGFVLLNADRWIAAQALGKMQFSHYAFAWTLLMVAQSIQAVLNASIFPFLARSYASRGVAPTYRICAGVSCILLLWSAVLAVPAMLLIKYAIARWFPDYRDSIALVPLFILVGATRISDLWTSFMVIVGRERQLIVLNSLAVSVSVGLWCAYVRPWSGTGPGLWEVGVLAALLSGCNYLLLAGAAWRARSA